MRCREIESARFSNTNHQNRLFETYSIHICDFCHAVYSLACVRTYISPVEEEEEEKEEEGKKEVNLENTTDCVVEL